MPSPSTALAVVPTQILTGSEGDETTLSRSMSSPVASKSVNRDKPATLDHRRLADNGTATSETSASSADSSRERETRVTPTRLLHPPKRSPTGDGPLHIVHQRSTDSTTSNRAEIGWPHHPREHYSRHRKGRTINMQ